MFNQRTRSMAALAVVMLLATACSGNDDGEAPTAQEQAAFCEAVGELGVVNPGELVVNSDLAATKRGAQLIRTLSEVAPDTLQDAVNVVADSLDDLIEVLTEHEAGSDELLADERLDVFESEELAVAAEEIATACSPIIISDFELDLAESTDGLDEFDEEGDESDEDGDEFDEDGDEFVEEDGEELFESDLEFLLGELQVELEIDLEQAECLVDTLELVDIDELEDIELPDTKVICGIATSDLTE